MHDIQLWTVDLTPNKDFVLEALLAAVPGMSDGPCKVFLQTVAGGLQRRMCVVEGGKLDLINVADSVLTYYQNGLRKKPCKDTHAELVRAEKLFADVQAIVNGKPARIVKVEEPPKPKPVRQGSLFGDEE